ncbi:hypothetical protein PEX1_042590 [Penicillium expansum]|uniref:Uncharacterized protein n=1 Tax=Penicillium expansum TaxID=27334 RepID=A0A0A2IVJ9_PENEN|nr:hypothetical protein PEX2_028510 [Penicillium expansum]KGO46531.1 hypothetical protein PEXP_067000 [Penicillium expansum]KGO50286.1 hypothetical protein PEX2_028510 [Penicillium expansum]KGO71507.1 hypothetical protein PEX1_042590 [Penicillium expansum]
MGSSRPLLFPTLAVQDLKLTDVETIFHLTQATNTDWDQFRVSFEVPDDCSMIRAQRRYEGRANCTVFGLSTDNEQFHFLRINNKGEGSDARINELEQIQRSEKKLETAHENDKLKNVLERYRDR